MNDKNINDLSQKIKDAKVKAGIEEKQQPDATSEDSNNMRVGLRAGTELVTAIAAGGLIGYFMDKNFETQPLFLLVMLVLGVITGFVNVWRVSQGLDNAVGLGRAEDEKEKKEKQNQK